MKGLDAKSDIRQRAIKCSSYATFFKYMSGFHINFPWDIGYVVFLHMSPSNVIRFISLYSNTTT